MSVLLSCCILALAPGGLTTTQKPTKPQKSMPPVKTPVKPADPTPVDPGPRVPAKLSGEGERYAILIGIDKYRDSRSLAELKGAANDVEELGKSLVDQAGFKPDNVVVLSTRRPEESPAFPTRSNIGRAYVDLMKRSKSAKDTVFLYVAGHGITLGNSAYFFCQDSTPDGIGDPSLLNMLDTGALLALNGLPARTIVAAFDMCRNEPRNAENTDGRKRNVASTVLRNSLSVRVSSATGPVGGGSDTTPLRTVIWMACQPGQSSYEMQGQDRGLFSYWFQRGLYEADMNRDGAITLDELNRFLTTRVPRENEKQTPDPRIEGPLTGDFVFALPKPFREAAQTVPDFKPSPSKVLQSPPDKDGKIRQSVQTFEGAYSIVNGSSWCDITSGEGGFTIRVPEPLRRDPERKEIPIDTPDGPAKLVTYDFHGRSGYNYTAYSAAYVDYPKDMPEKKVLDWAQKFVADPKFYFQKELKEVTIDLMKSDKDPFSFKSGSVLDLLIGSKKKKIAGRYENKPYNVAGSLGQRMRWYIDANAVDPETREAGERGSVTVQIIVLGQRVYLLKEGYLLDKEGRNFKGEGFVGNFRFMEDAKPN